MNGTALLTNLIVASAARDYRGFRRRRGEYSEVQLEILSDIVTRNAATRFGQDHRFADIRGYGDFVRRVPPQDYESLLPYIRQITSRDSRALTAEPVRLFEPTSGSSSATKFIPYTDGLQKEFYRAINPWISDIYRSRPWLKRGRSYWSISPPTTSADELETSVPIGFEDDSAYLSGIARRLVEKTFAVPAAVKREPEPDRFFDRLSAALLWAPDLSLISIWNPTAFLLLFDHIAQNWERILTRLDPQAATRVGGAPKTLARRIDRLTGLLASDPIPWREIWPDLRFISCWADGANRRYADALGALFPDAEIQAKGLIATEGIVTIPFEGHSSVPAYRSHFLEFQTEGGEYKLLNQLSEGEAYRVLLTTSGGLYRYQLGDIVTVTGYADGLPLLQFVSRDRVLDHFGEKLHVGFVESIVGRALEKLEMRPPFLLFAFEGRNTGGCYTLFLGRGTEDGRQAESAAEQGELPQGFDVRRLGRLVEDGLRENYHYRHALDLHQLSPLEVFVVTAAATDHYFARLTAGGMKAGDIKQEIVSSLTNWSRWLTGDSVSR